jgi:hypothetical protein
MGFKHELGLLLGWVGLKPLLFLPASGFKMLYELLGLIMSILYSTTSDKLKEKSATTGPKPLFHGGPKK